MKKKILTALILSAMMTASLASCGDVKDNDSKSDASSAAASTDTDVTGEEDTTAEEDKDVEPTAEEDSSKADDDSSKSDDSAPEETEEKKQATLHDTYVSKIAAYTFDNGHSFSELNSMGFANAYDEGKAYAIVSMEGGAAAGSVYYNVLNSTDGGENWLPCETYREANGNNYHIALDDGAVLLLSTGSARQETYPVVSYLYFDGIGIKAVELTDVLADLKLADDTLLKDAENLELSMVGYGGGYTVELTFTDPNTYETAYEGEFDFTEAIQTALNAQ
jgi:hypothetical protein